MDYTHPLESVFPGAQSRVLAVLARVDVEFSLRTLARVAQVSPAQVSRIMPPLVELGLVQRRDISPLAMFRMIRTHVASQAVIALLDSRATVLRHLGSLAETTNLPAASIIVFGSFARRESEIQSDIDIVIVRPDDMDEDSRVWVDPILRWQEEASCLSGNEIQILEYTRTEVHQRLNSDVPLWDNILQDGIVVFGESLSRLQQGTNG